MPALTRTVIPAESAITIWLKRGQRCRVVNTEGGQVVDSWAFNAANFDEYLSMEHSRSATYHLMFKPGDVLVSNLFQPMLKLTADTSAGFHDSLHAACSDASNLFYGAPSQRPNCQHNLQMEMSKLDETLSHIPCPWNLFEHARVNDSMELVDEPSAAKPGDYVEFEAMLDLVLVFSACPSRVGLISGAEPRCAAVDLLN